MKIANTIKILPLLVLMLSACVESEVKMPFASVEVSTTACKINESVIFHFNGVAPQVSIFTGDKSHDYDLIEQGNTGFVVNKNTFSYAYKQPGIYKVVIVATNLSDGAEKIWKDTSSLIIRVTDEDATIKALSCPKVLYDEIAAENMNDTDWLVRLPQKIQFAGKVATITSRQRLSVKLASDSTVLLVNGLKFNSTTLYELKTPIALNLKAHSGNTNDYTLYMLRLPEFTSFKLAGVEGVLTRSEFNYNKMTMTVTLPAGTDKTSLIPQFTLVEGQEVYVNNVLQTSGVSVVDFTGTGGFPSEKFFYRKASFDSRNRNYSFSSVGIGLVFLRMTRLLFYRAVGSLSKYFSETFFFVVFNGLIIKILKY